MDMLHRLNEKIRPHIFSISILVLITFSIYWQALGHPFLILWDDRSYVTNNTIIKGLTWQNIKTVFSSSYFYNYAPIHLISYMVDYTLWGLRPAGFIFTNIFIHAANGVLFYFLLKKWWWRTFPAFIAALIFLIHPVQVESVVWISERKNVLSLFFFLIAFYCYLLYREHNGRFHLGFYVSTFFALVLSLLTKATPVVFPLVLLAFDICFPQKRHRRVWLVDKIPFFLAVLVAALLTIKSQSPEIGGGTTSYHGGTPLTTLYTMMPVLIRYLGMTLWPTNLSAVYSPAIKSGIDLEVALSAMLLFLIMVLGIFFYYRKRDLLFWLLTFFLGLLPVSQIVPLVTLMHDRYLYLPMIGASAFLSSLFFMALHRDIKWRKLVNATVILVLLIFFIHCSISTITRIPVWQNDRTLWQDAILKVPYSPKAHYQYAHVMELEGNLNEAIKHYEAGLKLSPLPSERYFLALLYQKRGLWDKAIEHYTLALSQMPNFLEARNGLALLYMKMGMINQTIEQYRLGLAYQLDWAKGHNNLGAAYATRGDTDKALEHFEIALRLDPRDSEIHYNLGNIFLEKGWRGKAFEEFQKAATLDPVNPLYQRKLSEMSQTENVRDKGKKE
jgi:tetratricopeptide (TPR) repeat protein